MRARISVLLLVSLFGLSLTANPVNALSGAEFQAGRIMDDSIFFGTGNISPGDIQIFLNSKVPSCDTNGTKAHSSGTTRAAYATSRGYSPPYTCLKDFSQDTPTRTAETGLCNQYTGGTKSAAQIIYDVGISCGINPRTLIVLLEKEQSLVTDDWPWSTQYRSATGYGCPDTAPCDAEYYGFFNQVYSAARQFKKYQRDSSLFRYRSNRDNYIQYNPNASCGGTNVYIQNQATAGLYNYTPYQPNAAALANLGGIGDGCSAYGNRNFWVLFNKWFGAGYGPAYSGDTLSFVAYADSGRTQPYTNITTLQPGATAYYRVKVRNNGYLPWDQSSVKIGTNSPNDRVSPFVNGTWLSPTRPTKMIETSVAPSEIATFEFSITAPSTSGTYRENYGVLIEGKSWLTDIRLSSQINVVTSTPPPSPSATLLSSGSELTPGKYMLDPSSQSNLFLQPDGNLVLYTDFQPIWYSGTSNKVPKRLLMQSDGNLVLYDTNNVALWASGTSGNPGAYLALQYDGNLVIYSASGGPLWTTRTVHIPAHNAYVNTSLHTSSLYPGQQITTADRKYKLVLQFDGNLVLYSPSKAIWATGTDGKLVSRLSMQSDGNLVLYDTNGKPLWHSYTYNKGISALVIQTDGNLVIYDGLGRATWNSQTAGQ